MAAAVSIVRGKEEMAYVGETPWHGLGQKLKENAPIETWLVEAGMNWDVKRSRVRYGEGKNQQVYESQHVLFRSDTKSPLGIVGEGYKIVQPKAVLEFFRDLTADNKMTLETAGTLFGGKRYWALAKMNHTFSLPGKDAVGEYLLLATSCDGTLRTTAKHTNVRVVCNNTLAMSFNDMRSSAVHVSHASVFSESKVKMDLGLLDEEWKQFETNARILSSRKISRKEGLLLLVDALGDSTKFAIDKAKDGVEKAIESQPGMSHMAAIMKLFDGEGRGSDMASAKGTAWGLVNAATEFYDHGYGRDASNRLSSAWFGPNEAKKRTVAAKALALALAA